MAVLGVTSESVAFVSAAHLQGFAEFDAPPCCPDVSAWIAACGADDVWVVNTRAVPMLDVAIPAMAAATQLQIGGRVAAVRLSALEAAEHEVALRAGTWPFAERPASQAHDFDGVWLDAVWDIVRHVVALLQRDIPHLAARGSATRLEPSHSSIVVSGPHAVWVDDEVVVEPMAYFDTSAGPVLLRRGTRVQAFTRMVGPCYVGEHCTLSTDRIAASAIGEHCRVHGELSTSVLLGHSNKSHDGFVGHSVLGRWVNLGAGTITSNLKNTYGPVALWTPTGVRDSGMQFLGTFFGDHAKSGIGLCLTTGCVIGTGANVFEHMPPKAVAPFAWGSTPPYATHAVDKFLDTAARMMARREVVLRAEQRAWWATVHAHAAADARWPRG
jgi:UDP-N-acetylglucosamine diphosphorylase/glucosamine-1-phosphate N-acetyltransferase